VEALHQVQQLRVQGTEQSGGLLEEGRRQEGGGREGAVEAVRNGRVEAVAKLHWRAVGVNAPIEK
jgi:hypothetical protein